MNTNEPFAYTCPSNCGCLWRDNRDGSMSLFGPKSQSCTVCEPLSLDKLLPLYLPSVITPAPPSPQQGAEPELHAQLPSSTEVKQ